MGILAKVAAVLRRDGERDGASTTDAVERGDAEGARAGTDGADAADGTGDDDGSSQLYRCDDCDTTYISTDLDACPECRDDLEAVPDERELGMDPSR